MPLASFHPAVTAWFRGAFPAPTPAQVAAWPAIRSGRHTLVAAPTGSGKTLTGFLTAIDALVREGLARGLPDATVVLYVSPLKALSNDIHVNLEKPLAGIRDALMRLDLPDVEIRTAVRTGDTTQAERERMRRKPPHILVTTPESLYVLLGSESGRLMLGSVREVIVDEIHAVAASKRGSHLALSIERLEALCGRRLTRIGLSATQKPVERVARFLVGGGRRAYAAPLAPHAQADGEAWMPNGEGTKDGCSPRSPCDEEPDCTIVDVGYTRRRDLALEVPPVPLQPVMSNDVWELVYARLAELIQAHRTTLVFVNTRRMAERAARHLAETLGKEAVAAHHGSLARELRLDAEQRLKRGELRVLVATASLELGIDIGDVDLVCQLGSPRSIATLLQRVGRSGHAVGGTPKGRLFPQTRDDLVECAALLDCVRRGELDALTIPSAPLDVLAQQIVAEVAAREWDEDALFDLVHRAAPYAGLARKDFDALVRMLAEGFTTRRGVRAGYLHRDAVHRRLRGRKGARMTAVMSGGTIPDTGDYAVVLEPQAQTIGSVNEDFAVESMTGDIFQLGNTSYRILRIEPGRVRVEDAQGAPPNIPFWLGEAPGRSDELSVGVSRLREEIAARLEPLSLGGRGVGERVTAEAEQPASPEHSSPAPLPRGEMGKAELWLVDEVGIAPAAAQQIVDYIARTQSALGVLPTQRTLALERFFDESGGTQLLIHSPYGSRVNRAWGLALRKRFCRKFNFELQAAATEDAIVLSLSTSHSFPLGDVAHYLHSASAEDVLVQALLDAPLFGVRWRWNATTALALPRFSGGKKVPPQLQRMRSEDLLAMVFPDQVACAENLVGERQVPDHPLVAQTLDDCLHEAMDTDGWLRLLRAMEAGEVQVAARDLAAPSPLAAEALNARPYAFLDDAPLEERRTQAVLSRRFDPDGSDDLGRLDIEAIQAVREEAWPEARSADEMHEALMGLGFVTAREARENAGWAQWLARLGRDHRATCLGPPVGAAIAPASLKRTSPQDSPGGTQNESRSGRAHLPRFAGEDGWGRAATVAPGSGLKPLLQEDEGLWFAAERLPQARALFPDAPMHPAIEAPAEYAAEPWFPEDALLELVRARLTGLGPAPAQALADALSQPRPGVEAALLRLEAEGYVMRGRFTPDASTEEWCERHLLARIHRRTVQRLRREIEPVEMRDFMRFLFDWQRVAPAARVSGPEALAGVVAQLEGFEAPAGAWETELLRARISDYTPSWLDDLCLAGRVVWTRLRANAETTGRGGGPVRATPVVLAARRHLPAWDAVAGRARDGDAPLGSRAQRVADRLASHGASFFDELLADTRLLQPELEDALAELVARGRVHSDSFAGLRALLVPSTKRASSGARRGRRAALFGIQDAGRWALIRRAQPEAGEGGEAAKADPEQVEHVARILLRRYGVVGWRLLAREAEWLPPWRELLRVYRRLEARGEIRGGRFVAGLSGEQYALPEAVGLLRQIRQRPHDGALVGVSGADPLNLTGMHPAGSGLPGNRVPRLTGARVVYRDGVPLAGLVAGKVEWLTPLPAADQRAVRRVLLRQPEAVAVVGAV